MKIERVSIENVAWFCQASCRKVGMLGVDGEVQITGDQVDAILKMVADGEKITKVARITGLSRQTVYRVLKNRSPEANEAA